VIRVSIGKKIRELRESRNMTLDEVAKLCGTTRQAIYKYENEIVTNIPYDKIILLARALNATPSQLFEWEEGKKRSPHDPLTEGEELMLQLFRQIPEDQQPVVLAMIKAALCTGK
jgi:transcriptional regulator with XRE-family HTH domain